MNDDLTDINFILDRSGSMFSIATDTIGGFNAFLKSQKEAPGKAKFTFVQFDTEYTVLQAGTDIQAVQDLTTKTFIPRGGTALLDAIGRTITVTGARLASMSNDERPGKVIFVILTDGQENCSQEFTKKQINTMITHQQEKYDWDFVFLAANQDAISAGMSMGIARGSSMTFAATSKGTHDSYSTVAANMTAYRSGSAAVKSSFFTDEDKAKQEV